MTLKAPDEAASQPSRPQKLDWERTAPMSFGQSRFWFLRRYIEDQTTFNVAFSARLKGALHVAKFDSAIQTLGQRHQALRTAFVPQPDQQLPVQAVLKNSPLRLERKQIREASDASQTVQAMLHHVFDIEHGESMRVVLLTLTPTDHFLVMGYHHINMDGASLEVFLADLTALYEGKRLVPEPHQYPDFAVQQQLDFGRGKMDSDIAYWKAQLAELPAALPLLPYASVQTRTPLHRYEHNRVDRRLDAAFAARIQTVCREQKASPFHFYLAVLQATLFRLLDAQDLCIGMADANRFEGNLASSVGMYLNLLPLRFRLSGDQAFTDVLKATRHTAYAAMAHAGAPFDLVLDNLRVPRSTMHSPVFQAFINYRAGLAEERTMGALKVEGVSEGSEFGRTAYDINLNVLENPGGDPRLMFVVQKQLYSEEEAGVLADTFMHLLDYFTARPASTLKTPPAFSPRTVQRAIEFGRGPPLVSAWPETIVHRVEDMVRQHASTIAVRDPQGGRAGTYTQLASRTNAIARTLLALGVSRGARVAVFQEPSLDWVCSMLAIMRIGAAFVPLDVGTSVERLEAMAEAARPTVALLHDATASQNAALKVFERAGARNIQVPETLSSEQGHVPIMARSRDVAMVLFTSGSTGVPKGVVLPHEGLPNYMEHTNIRGPEVVLHHTTLGFDLASLQCFAALAHSGTLDVAGRALRADPLAITTLMAKEGITCTSATSSEYLSWIEYGCSRLTQCTSWRIAMTVGEPCTPTLVDAFRKLQLPGLCLWNCYGPSEITWVSHQTEVPLTKTLERAAPVGRTMPNRSVYVVDSELRPTCVGMPGEVLIGGAGLGQEYLDNEALSKEKFLPDRWASESERAKGWGRMYRTGDRGRLTAQGELEILGRIDGDSQIKLRGIRTELQDIEQVMLRCADGALASACVTVRGGPPTLVAHAVFRADCTVPQQERDVFLHRLATSLPIPQYMRPAAVVAIPSMPLTPHGKLDGLAVQQMPISVKPEASDQQPRAVPAARLSTQVLELCRVWQQVIPGDVLSRHTVGHDTDFFHVGGNSMLLIKVQHLIQQRFAAQVPIVCLFEHSTLRAMTAAVQDVVVATADAEMEIDWDDETAVPKAFIDAVPSRPVTKPIPTTGITVILTGATGFIGRELLAQLDTSPKISKVHCIAVRTPSKLAAFSSSGKVSIHAGDLASLEEDDDSTLDANLFRDAHALIHCGADVSFLKTYATLRRPNLASTKALARLAVKHGLAFHYISTVGTGRLLRQTSSAHHDDANNNNNNQQPPAVCREHSLAAQPPPPGWRDGYVASKWASEAFLERAARAGPSGHLRVCVHRPSSVTGAGAPETDVVASVVRFSRRLRAVPVSGRWKGVLDFVAVGTVARGVVRAVLGEGEGGQGAGEGAGGGVVVRFVHHCGEVVVPLDGLQEYLEKEDGVEYRAVSLREWVEIAASEGLNELVAAYLVAVDEADQEVVFQSYVKGG